MMKFWLALVALTSASADVAFRWPDGMVSTFASLIFWYLLFIMAAIAVMKFVDRRWSETSGVESAEL